MKSQPGAGWQCYQIYWKELCIFEHLQQVHFMYEFKLTYRKLFWHKFGLSRTIDLSPKGNSFIIQWTRSSQWPRYSFLPLSDEVYDEAWKKTEEIASLRLSHTQPASHAVTWPLLWAWHSATITELLNCVLLQSRWSLLLLLWTDIPYTYWKAKSKLSMLQVE